MSGTHGDVAGARGGSGVRPGLTLIEILIVLALLLALAAVVFPTLATRYRRVLFTTTAERVVSFCAEVRAEALRSGTALVVKWNESERRLRVEALDDGAERQGLFSDSYPKERNAAASPDASMETPSFDDASEADLQSSHLARLTVQFEIGFVIVTGFEALHAGAAGGPEYDAVPGAFEEDWPEEVTASSFAIADEAVPLILLLPDGTAFSLASQFGLRHRDGRVARYQVDIWSGRLTWEEVAASSADEAGTDSERTDK